MNELFEVYTVHLARGGKHTWNRYPPLGKPYYEHVHDLVTRIMPPGAVFKCGEKAFTLLEQHIGLNRGAKLLKDFDLGTYDILEVAEDGK